MKWYWHKAGGHVHVRVFMNGGKCGDLCFRDYEFEMVRGHCPWIQFAEEDPPSERMQQLRKRHLV